MKRLNKTQLFTMLRDQELEISQLRQENEELKAALNAQTIQMQETGSIAEAAMRINMVFESAQKAADQYVQSVKARWAQREAEADRIEKEAKKNAEILLLQAHAKCEHMENETRRKVDEAWKMLKKRLDEYLDLHKGLREILEQNRFH